jgi:hypothetical protein
MPFLHFENHGFCIDILFNGFHMDSIEILWYWKFVMSYHKFDIVKKIWIKKYEKNKKSMKKQKKHKLSLQFQS